MTDEVEVPVEVTDPETIETPAETFTQVEEPDESETITAPEPTAEATDDPMEDDE